MKNCINYLPTFDIVGADLVGTLGPVKVELVCVAEGLAGGVRHRAVGGAESGDRWGRNVSGFKGRFAVD